MIDSSDSDELEQKLMKNGVEVRKLIQDFTCCANFREVDELNKEVRHVLDQMRNNIAALDTKAREQSSLEEKERLLAQVEEHQGQLTACQRQFRQANVKQMTVLENQASRDLMSSSSNSQLRHRKDKEQLAKEHANVTESLKAISRQLADTVERSKQTVGTLEGSSTTVQENSEEHKSMAGVIGQSKKLITKYGRRELTDKVLIIFAVGFFFAVVLYILRKRLFPTYGPLELIFYLFSLTKHLFAFLSNLIPSFS